MEKRQDIPYEELSEAERVRRAFGTVVRSRRVREGYYQKAFSHAAGISESHLRKIEGGEISPTIVTVYKICSVLDCSTTSLFIEFDDILRHPNRPLQNRTYSR